MDLESMSAAKVNTRVLVNGTTYEIDAQGILRDASDGDGEKLLENPNWKVYTGESNRVTPAGHKRAKAAMKLIDSGGSEVDGQTGETGAETPTDPGVPPIPDEDDNTPNEATSEAGAEDTSESMDPPLPTEGDEEEFEWADPDIDYSKEWLVACADAYNVKHAEKMKPETLVAKIRAAMYDD